jgi:ribosomal protein L30E
MREKGGQLPKLTEQEARDALRSALSLCRKAGKLVMGYDPVAEAILSGKADFVLCAADTSPKTAQRMADQIEGLAPLYRIPLTQEELLPVSRKNVGLYAVADPHLAALCESKRKQWEDLGYKEEVSE